MDLVQLQSFAQVAERGTVAAAAAAQGYTAPAVSQHVAKLERHLGAALFDRVGGRLVVTVAGAALLPIALEMLELDGRGRAAVATPTAMPRVVLAGFASAIETVVIPRLAALRKHAVVEISEAEDADALRDLALGAVDVVLTQEYGNVATDRNRRCTYTPLATDQLTLVLPRRRAPSTTLDQLHDASWLLNGVGTRCAQATLRLLADAGIVPRIVGAVSDNATLLALVAAGQGVTIVPALVLGGRRRGLTVAAQQLGVSRTIHAVTRRAVTPALSAVLDVLS